MLLLGFLGGSVVKNLPAMQETLSWDDPLKEGTATHSSTLYLENSVDRRTWHATVHRVAQSRTRLVTKQQQQERYC